MNTIENKKKGIRMIAESIKSRMNLADEQKTIYQKEEVQKILDLANYIMENELYEDELTDKLLALYNARERYFSDAKRKIAHTPKKQELAFNETIEEILDSDDEKKEDYVYPEHVDYSLLTALLGSLQDELLAIEYSINYDEMIFEKNSNQGIFKLIMNNLKDNLNDFINAITIYDKAVPLDESKSLFIAVEQAEKCINELKKCLNNSPVDITAWGKSCNTFSENIVDYVIISCKNMEMAEKRI